MPKEHVNPKALFSSLPHGFSQVVVASGTRTAFIAGQTAWDAQKRLVGEGSLLDAQYLARSLGPGETGVSDRD